MIKKKILHVTKTYYPFSYGGIEKTIEIITRKKFRLFEHEIVSTNSKNKNFNFIKNIRHKSFKRDLNILSSPFSFNLVKFLFEKKNSYNIIHFHYPWPFLNILIYFLDKKVKKVVTYHSDAISGYKIIDLLYFPFAFLFLSKMDIIIATSRNYQKSSFLLNFLKKK